MACEKTLTREYDNRILDLAQKIVSKQAFDTNQIICGEDYLKAKRYKHILHYLANDACCPDKVRTSIIEKLHLNGKL